MDKQIERNRKVLNRYIELFRTSENVGLIAVMIFCLLKCGKEDRFIISDNFSEELERYSARIWSLGLAEAIRPFLQGKNQRILFDATIVDQMIEVPPHRLKAMIKEVEMAKEVINKMPIDSNSRVKFDDLVSCLCSLTLPGGSLESTQ